MAHFIGYWVVGLPVAWVLCFPYGWGVRGILGRADGRADPDRRWC